MIATLAMTPVAGYRPLVPSILESIGPALALLRKKAGIDKQEPLALKVGRKNTAISRYERPHGNVEMKTLLRYLEAVGANLHDLAAAVDEVSGQAPAPRTGQVHEDVLRSIEAKETFEGSRGFIEAIGGARVRLAPADLAATMAEGASRATVRVLQRMDDVYGDEGNER